jgi:hypothetical protein
VIGQYDIRLELPKGVCERVFGFDAIRDGGQAGSMQLVTDQLGVSLIVLEY